MARPREYDSSEDFDAMVDDYIKWCKENEEPITWTGLALHLGFCSRESIDEYLKYDGFSDSVKRAKALVENAYEKRLSGNNATGAIFALKNFDWADKSQQEISGPGGKAIEFTDTERAARLASVLSGIKDRKPEDSG